MKNGAYYVVQRVTSRLMVPQDASASYGAYATREIVWAGPYTKGAAQRAASMDTQAMANDAVCYARKLCVLTAK